MLLLLFRDPEFGNIKSRTIDLATALREIVFRKPTPRSTPIHICERLHIRRQHLSRPKPCRVPMLQSLIRISAIVTIPSFRLALEDCCVDHRRTA